MMYNVNNFFKKTKGHNSKQWSLIFRCSFHSKKFFFLDESVSIDFLKTDTEKLIANS